MDLKDAITSVTEKVTEAQNAYHAGHPETSILCFKNIMEEIRAYFEQMSPDEVAALEATTHEHPEEVQTETQEPDSASKPGTALPASQFLGENAGQVIQSEKPNQ